MIMRIWHGATPAARADDYLEYLRATGLKEYRATPGNRGVQIVRRISEGQADFLTISLWDSLDAIRSFAGDDIERTVYYPEDAAYLLEREPTVTHYEVLVDDRG
jgi:heme-degrading monooxygenase HmoA